MIEARNLHKRFGDVIALDGVSFRCEDGRITGLLGPNGAGKTTALRILCTVMHPDEGSATVDGFDTVRAPREVLSRIGALPDQRGLYPRLTARENIRYYGRLHGMRGLPLERAIERLIHLLDLEDAVDRRTEGFSQGQRTKVAIARALVHGPRTVLLDEPTNGLDVMSTRAMRHFVLRLKDDGCCVLFSSHVMQEVAALCDDVVLVGAGRVVASGTPDALRAQTGRPDLEDAFVAALGSAEGLE